MIKRFCDKCEKEITNDGENHHHGISFLDAKDGKTKYVDLCSECYKDLIDTNLNWLYNKEANND
jgi:hypothetical protein